jgi:hypothetical protein
MIGLGCFRPGKVKSKSYVHVIQKLYRELIIRRGKNNYMANLLPLLDNDDGDFGDSQLSQSGLT